VNSVIVRLDNPLFVLVYKPDQASVPNRRSEKLIDIGFGGLQSRCPQ
jgi:hypothetical protein